MLQKAFFGPVGSFPPPIPCPTCVGREAWSLVPLLVLCLAIGVYPKPLIDTVKPDIDAIAGMYIKLHVDRVASSFRRTIWRSAADVPLRSSVRAILPECLLDRGRLPAISDRAVFGDRAEGRRRARSESRLGGVSLGGIASSRWLWREFPVPARLVDTNLLASALFRSDSLAGFFRGVAIIAGIVLVLINWGHIVDEYAAEFHGLILLMIAGVSLTASANDLIVLFLALELVSIPTYVFLYLPRREPGGPEATTKYFLLSIFSSAIVLYGFSFLYGGRRQHALERRFTRLLVRLAGRQRRRPFC